MQQTQTMILKERILRCPCLTGGMEDVFFAYGFMILQIESFLLIGRDDSEGMPKL